MLACGRTATASRTDRPATRPPAFVRYAGVVRQAGRRRTSRPASCRSCSTGPSPPPSTRRCGTRSSPSSPASHPAAQVAVAHASPLHGVVLDALAEGGVAIGPDLLSARPRRPPRRTSSSPDHRPSTPAPRTEEHHDHPSVRRRRRPCRADPRGEGITALRASTTGSPRRSTDPGRPRPGARDRGRRRPPRAAQGDRRRHGLGARHRRSRPRPRWARRGTATSCGGWRGPSARRPRAEGVQVVLGPGVNMKRSPLCGRNFEYFSEDPMHAGELGSRVRRRRPVGRRWHVAQALRGEQPGDRAHPDLRRSPTSARCARPTSPAFERVVRLADPWTVMCSYNRLFGVHASAEPLAADRGAAGRLGLRRARSSPTGTPCTTGSPLVRAGPRPRDAGHAGRDGRASSSRRSVAASSTNRVVDDAARRVLQLVAHAPTQALTWSTGPSWTSGTRRGPARRRSSSRLLNADEHHALAREAAAGVHHAAAQRVGAGSGRLRCCRSPRRAAARIAVVGAFAEHARIQGGGSSGVDPTRSTSRSTLLRAIAGDRVVYAPGYVHATKNAYQDDNRAS